MDRIGRKETYALGWSIVCVFGFVIGGAMFPLSNVFPLFIALFGLFQTFLSVGPGDCNFLVSSESFATPLRGHFLGLAAAIGKAGAAVGTSALIPIVDNYDHKLKGQQVLFLIGSAISVVGTLVVWFLIPRVRTHQGNSISASANNQFSRHLWHSRMKMNVSKVICKKMGTTFRRWA